jgi:hypothetical protein
MFSGCFGATFFENIAQVLNVGTIAEDRTLDLFRDTKVGPYREN